MNLGRQFFASLTLIIFCHGLTIPSGWTAELPVEVISTTKKVRTIDGQELKAPVNAPKTSDPTASFMTGNTLTSKENISTSGAPTSQSNQSSSSLQVSNPASSDKVVLNDQVSTSNSVGQSFVSLDIDGEMAPDKGDDELKEQKAIMAGQLQTINDGLKKIGTILDTRVEDIDKKIKALEKRRGELDLFLLDSRIQKITMNPEVLNRFMLRDNSGKNPTKGQYFAWKAEVEKELKGINDALALLNTVKGIIELIKVDINDAQSDILSALDDFDQGTLSLRALRNAVAATVEAERKFKLQETFILVIVIGGTVNMDQKDLPKGVLTVDTDKKGKPIMVVNPAFKAIGNVFLKDGKIQGKVGTGLLKYAEQKLTVLSKEKSLFDLLNKIERYLKLIKVWD